MERGSIARLGEVEVPAAAVPRPDVPRSAAGPGARRPRPPSASGASPNVKQTKGWSIASSTPWSGEWTAAAPPSWRTSTCSSGEPTNAATIPSIVDGREIRQQEALARVGQRVVGSRFTRLRSLAGIDRDRVELRTEVAQRANERRPVGLGADEAALHQDERAAAQMLGEERAGPGSWSIRPSDSQASGTVSIQAHHALRISRRARSARTGRRRRSWPPETAPARARSPPRRCRPRRGAPRTGRARCRGRRRTSRPSAVTTSAATMLLQASP